MALALAGTRLAAEHVQGMSGQLGALVATAEALVRQGTAASSDLWRVEERAGLPLQGSRFSTYATWWVRQRLQRAVADQGRTIRLPRHISDKVDRLRRATGDGFEGAGPLAAPNDLAEAAGLAPGEAPRLLLLAVGTTSLHAPVGGGDTALEHFLADKAATQPLDAALQSEIVAGVRHALARLEPREARVLGLRYGIGTAGEHTTADVARQLGLSRERVRQIQRDALEHLRDQAPMLEGFLDDDARRSPDASGAGTSRTVQGSET